MSYQYPNNTYDNGTYGYSQEQQGQQYSLNNTSYPGQEQQGPSLYPGSEQQGPPTIVPPEKQQQSYTDTYPQYASPPPQQNFLSMPEVPTSNPSNQYNDNTSNPQSYDNNPQSYDNNPQSYDNNLYHPPVEPSYNNYNNYTYNPGTSYDNNNTYNSPYETNNNIYNAQTYNPPEQYTISPHPPQSYNNNNDYSPYPNQPYSNQPYSNQPYSGTQNYNYNHTQSQSTPTSTPTPKPTSTPYSHSDDQSPKPPKSYEPPNSPRPPKNYSSSHPEGLTPSSSYAPNQGYTTPNNDEGREKREKTKRPPRNDCDCADCCSFCGCLRCTCTVIIFIFAAILIAIGISLIGFSKSLPGKCPGICDPTNGRDPNIPSSINNGDNPLNNARQDCSSLCQESIYKTLFYGGMGFIGLGALMVITQLLCICCRVGSSGGKGTGCCYCC